MLLELKAVHSNQKGFYGRHVFTRSTAISSTFTVTTRGYAL